MNLAQRLPAHLQSRLLRATLAAHEARCALRRAAGRREVLVLGDSHVLPFLRMTVPHGWDGDFYRVVAVEGATVSGLPNPHARTAAAQRFDAALRTTNAREVIVNLGEVDTGFVIWFRAQRDGVDVEAMFEQALSRYQALVDDLARHRRVTLISAPLPTLADDTPLGEVARRRSAVRVPQRERIALTRRFNDAMQRWCQARGLAYVALDAESLGPDGRVRRALLNPIAGDHHYAREAYRRLLDIALSRPRG